MARPLHSVDARAQEEMLLRSTVASTAIAVGIYYMFQGIIHQKHVGISS